MEDKMSKLIEKATLAKLLGFTHISSVVKSHFATTYYHVVSIDRVLAAGKWIPARLGYFKNGVCCREGVSGRHLPENCISRTKLWKL